ncbi:MAG TPA: acetate/propionate family kinase [Gemmataceae bacterium]|jgi:acetate kinase|nr:acetate/propionate family kinase [Gemmataceae bacterium]
MKILVANLGSTSFKYRLFDMADERVLARGGVERIGSAKSRSYARTDRASIEEEVPVKDHAAAVEACLRQLADPKIGALANASEISAIGFKAVHACGVSGVQRVDARILEAMEAFNQVAPAHNPPYVSAMRLLAEKLPGIPLIAAFETGFHESIAPALQLYATPIEWAEKHGVRRWGFHGASHRYIGERMAQLLERPGAKIISCHLGGSSSLCAIEGGQSRATTMGMSPQTGLPQNNRVGDFDPFALPALMRTTGKTLDELLEDLSSRSGLLGLSGGLSNDLRDLEDQSAKGNSRARLAIEVFVAAVRQYLGAYLVLLDGADAIAFTGGIGENSASMRQAVCDRLDWFGIRVDPELNRTATGEQAIHAAGSRVAIWILPTNEELIVARQAQQLLAS